MGAATVLYASGAVVLVIAGVSKAKAPAATAALFDDWGGPARLASSRVVLVRMLGTVEITLGLVALVASAPIVARLVGALYIGFALAVGRAMSVGAGSCGCFGRVEVPPSWYHVIGNTVLAAAAFVAASRATPIEVMDSQPRGGLGFVFLVGVLAGLALLTFTTLPEATKARRV